MKVIFSHFMGVVLGKDKVGTNTLDLSRVSVVIRHQPWIVPVAASIIIGLEDGISGWWVCPHARPILGNIRLNCKCSFMCLVMRMLTFLHFF